MPADPRPMIVGLFNPYSDDPWDALAPRPRNSSGGRLFAMLKSVDPDLAKNYMILFDRYNLINRITDVRRTELLRANAAGILTQARPGGTIVLLGEDVRLAFCRALGQVIHKVFLHPQSIDGIRFRVIPHTSGKSIIYNHEINKRLVGMMLADLCRGAARL